MARRSAEHELQKAIAAFLRVAMPPGTNWTAIDHAGTNAKHGAMLRARGVKSGVPDFHFTIKGKVHWIELKTRTGRVSPEQNAFAEAEMDAGAYYDVCRSAEEVEDQLRLWGVKLQASITRRAA